MTETNIERKARKSIIIYSALGIFLIGTIVFLVSIIPLYSRLKGGVQSNLVHAAKVRSMAVDEYISRAKDITLQVTSRTLIRKKLEAYNRGEITPEELIEFTKDKLADAMKLLLLAEDDTDVRSLIKDILESYGYKVIDAADGEDALRLFHKNREDIRMAILDVVMPKKNGREVYEEIKRIVPDIKVLFMSGYTADIISEKGILKAGLDFISKPVSPKDLLKLVREILDR